MSNATLQLGGGNFAVKDGKLLGYATDPRTSAFVSREFDFSRGSNLAATRVDANGLIEKGRENLLLHSNAFTTSPWAGSGTWTSGQTDKDGGTDAWLLTKSGSTNSDYYNEYFSGVQTFSIYVKKEVGKGIAVYNFNSGITSTAVWNIETGERIAKNAYTIDTNLVEYNSNWWRFDMSVNVTLGRWYIYATGGTSVLTTDTLVLQDAQLEYGLVATDYIETGATTAQAGILENMPRIDYKNSSSPALLLEPQRTNSIEQSEYFNTWNTIVNMTIDVNQGTSPEGHDNATKLLPTTFNGEHFIDKGGFSRTAGEYISHTIYAKADGYNYLYISNAASRLYGVYNLSNGSVGYVNSNGTDFTNHSANIEDAGNGWYRCTLIGQALTSVATYVRISCAPVAVDGQGYSFAGDGTSGVLVYGAQVETNSSYATSYIPTYGTAVTRIIENHQFNVTSIITSSSFTWFFDLGDWVGSATNGGTYELINASSSVRIQLRVRADGYRVYYQNTSGGSAYPVAGSKTANKFCIAYDGLNYRLFIDGSLVNTHPSVGDTNWSLLTNTGGIGAYETLTIKQAAIFPTALTDSDCIALTTP